MTSPDRIRDSAAQIIKAIGGDIAPHELLAALAVATGSAIATCYPESQRDRVIDCFCDQVRKASDAGGNFNQGRTAGHA